MEHSHSLDLKCFLYFLHYLMFASPLVWISSMKDIYVYMCEMQFVVVVDNVIVSIIAPRMTGILVKIFTWFLESPILGSLLFYILKGNNLIHKVSSWSMLSSFHFHEILFQLKQNFILFVYWQHFFLYIWLERLVVWISLK